MSVHIPQDIRELLESAVNANLEHFEIKQHKGNEKGEGFLGDMFFISLHNKTHGKVHDFVVKKVLYSSTDSATDFMPSCYMNEINFYTKYVPSIREFEKSYPDVPAFGNLPNCLATSSQRGEEKLILENLKTKNYMVHPKKVPLSMKMYEKIFDMYGKFHGVSYAFKILESEKFQEIANLFRNNFETKMTCVSNFLAKGVTDACIKMKKVLEDHNEHEIAEKLNIYVKDSPRLFTDSVTYKSPYSVIIHGDCWSNNLMFKFDKSGDIEDIKMLDFQLSMLGSPALDLVYSFYSGAAKDTLDNLEDFLKIYYNSFSEIVKQYGCDTKDIYPYEALKTEWKKCTSFGFLMGLLMWESKHSDLVDIPNISEITDSNMNEEESKENVGIKRDEESIEKCSLDLIRHMSENNFL